MRLLPWPHRLATSLVISLAFSLFAATTVEARHFWQTFGSTVPAADGCGCHWNVNRNVNQDYFVPRYCSSCRYGLYSPCKKSCLTSPACKACHPVYEGYCGIYGQCHYRRQDRVYQAKCGCKPLGLCVCGNCRKGSKCCGGPVVAGCCASSCCEGGAIGYGLVGEVIAPLPNVEAPQMVLLGSLPVEGVGLLTAADLSQVDGVSGGQIQLQGPAGALAVPQPGVPALVNSRQRSEGSED